MFTRAVFMAVALSFIIFLPNRIISQDTKQSNRTRETPTQKGMGRSYKVIGAAAQKGRDALGESTRLAGFEERGKDLSEFEQAEQFMQLKATVFADLNRLEESRRAKPKRHTVRDAHLDYRSAGNTTVNRANGRSIGESPAQATSLVLSVSSKSAGRSAP
jgi:hypothetical protein